MAGTDIDVLYIVGAGRSGSTVLERVVSALPGYACVGELSYLHRRGRELNERCSCGQVFGDCPFWQRIVVSAFDDEAHFHDHFLEQKYFGRLRRFPLLRFRLLQTRAFRDRLSHLHATQARLFAALHDASGRAVIVDSSKFVQYGYVLAANPALRVRVIHLIRDSRGVAFSWARKKRRPEAHSGVNDYMATFSPGMAARIWLMDNVMAAGLCRRLPRTVTLRYEDYCREPSIINQVLSALDLPCGETRDGSADPAVSARAEHTPDDVPDCGTMHSVSGNPARLTKGPLSLVADEEWRSSMPSRDKMLVTAITGAALVRYGYLPARPYAVSRRRRAASS